MIAGAVIAIIGGLILLLVKHRLSGWDKLMKRRKNRTSERTTLTWPSCGHDHDLRDHVAAVWVCSIGMAAAHLDDPAAPRRVGSEARLAKLAEFYHLPTPPGIESIVGCITEWAAETIAATDPPPHPALAAASVASPMIYDMANAHEWELTYRQALIARGALETLQTDLLLLLGEESRPALRVSAASDWRRRAAAATSTTADLAQIVQAAAQATQAAGWP